MVNSIDLKVCKCLCTLATLFFLSSCVNTISDDTLVEGNIPISLSTSIYTRIADNQYEDDDLIGVFLLSGGQTMVSDRYLDNEPYLAKAAKPQSDKTVYYPAGNERCIFISYYPYNKTGVLKGDNKITAFSAVDQSQGKDYSSSDFLIAKEIDVLPSKETVTLKHDHKLSLLNIVIQPSDGSSAEELIKTNPVITIVDVYSQCQFNLETGEISNVSNKQNIIPHGGWSISEGKLIGKSAILVPQTISQGTPLFNLEIEGRNYVCRVTENFELMSNKNNVLTIPCSKWNVGTPLISISDWEKGKEGSTSLEQISEGVSVSSLTFSQSNVYNVYNGQTEIASLCKEYLFADNVEAQAIVIYPVLQGKIDLKSGRVVKFLDKPENAGGSVLWDTSSNKLTYSTGDQKDVTTIYFNDMNAFSFTKPSTSITVRSVPDRMIDVRGSEIKDYPIVKIGSQFWMQSDLETTLYTDGSLLPLRTAYSKDDVSAGSYAVSDKPYHFYNKAIMNTGKMLPAGWNIPTETEWKSMLSYLGENAMSKLRMGIWSDDVSTPSNVAFFSVIPKGMILAKKDVDPNNAGYYYSTSAISYWASVADGNINSCVVFLAKSKNPAFYEAYPGTDLNSIRCIRR